MRAITGNILGATLGMGAIPRRWLETIELRKEIFQIAQDMVAVVTAESPDTVRAEMYDRYPPG